MIYSIGISLSEVYQLVNLKVSRGGNLSIFAKFTGADCVRLWTVSSYRWSLSWPNDRKSPSTLL